MSGEAADLHGNGNARQRQTPALAGIDIGGTRPAAVLSNVQDVLWREEFETLPSLEFDHEIQKIIAQMRRALAGTGTSLSAIGVSCGGPRDRIRGVIQRPPNLQTWDTFRSNSS